MPQIELKFQAVAEMLMLRKSADFEEREIELQVACIEIE